MHSTAGTYRSLPPHVLDYLNLFHHQYAYHQSSRLGFDYLLETGRAANSRKHNREYLPCKEIHDSNLLALPTEPKPLDEEAVQLR